MKKKKFDFFYFRKALKVFLNKSVKARPFNQLLCVHGKQDEDQEGSHFVVSLHTVYMAGDHIVGKVTNFLL